MLSLLATMKNYWYTANDRVWDTWSDAKARSYLVKNKVISEADAASYQRDKLEKLLEENWHKLPDNVNASWKDSEMRDWLIKHGYLKSDAQLKADDVKTLFSKHYSTTSSKTWDYLSWTDNRMRGWLRDHGVNVPMNSKRAELVQLMKENYVSTQSGLTGLLGNVQEWIGAGTHIAEDKVREALEILKGAVGVGSTAFGGYGEEAGLKGKYVYNQASVSGEDILSTASASASSVYHSKVTPAATKGAKTISAFAAGATDPKSISSLASVASHSAVSAASVGSVSASHSASSASASALSAASVASKVSFRILGCFAGHRFPG